MVRNLTPWIEEWCPDTVVGGIPGRDADELHQMFNAALERSREHQDAAKLMGASVDLSKCFDRVSPEMVIRVAEMMGLPKSIAEMRGLSMCRFGCYSRQHGQWIQSGVHVCMERCRDVLGRCSSLECSWVCGARS